MDLSLTASISFMKDIKEKLIKDIVQPYYIKSQEIYHDYHFSSNWRNLYEDIDFIIYYENEYTNDKQAYSKVFLTSKEIYNQIELLIEVHNNGIHKYQDTVSY